jgi:serine/threonine protein kinase
MKAPSVNYDDDPAFIDQFLHEEWAGRRINSAHTLQVIEPRGYRQCLYYITEYIDGQTLREWMHDHPRAPLRDVRVIAGQIASGLRAMHRQEMIHQDLKPDNVMLDRHGLVKIIDYGSTRIAGIDEIITPLARDTILGTRNYTAPEYLKGYPGSTRSDIYSLGVICYEMLCGKLPYGEELTARQAAKAHYHCASTINDRVPDWVDAALRKAVALNPAHRYGHLSEFIHDLSHPNPAYTGNHRAPLMERNPVAFWRALALVFLLSTLAALIGG